jgi:hypothetical protein
MIRRPAPLVGALVLGLLFSVASSGSVVAGKPAPRPQFLSSAEIEAALATMTPEERAGRSEFSDSRYGVIAYTRATQALDSRGMPTGSPTTQRFQAGNKHTLSIEPMATHPEGLTLTISISYDYEAAPHRWLIRAFFDWTREPSEMSGEDTFAIAWSGSNLALQSDSAWGAYTNNAFINSFYRSDASGRGVGWSFKEKGPLRYCEDWFPFECFYHYANYGFLNATIKETTWQNQYATVIAKYFHTFTSGDWSLTFGASPSISAAPSSGQWSLAEYTSFLR